MFPWDFPWNKPSSYWGSPFLGNLHVKRSRVAPSNHGTPIIMGMYCFWWDAVGFRIDMIWNWYDDINFDSGICVRTCMMPVCPEKGGFLLRCLLSRRSIFRQQPCRWFVFHSQDAMMKPSSDKTKWSPLLEAIGIYSHYLESREKSLDPQVPPIWVRTELAVAWHVFVGVETNGHSPRRTDPSSRGRLRRCLPGRAHQSLHRNRIMLLLPLKPFLQIFLLPILAPY